MVKVRRLLGLDLGAKRIGIALSDSLGLTAQPLSPVLFRNTGGLLAELKKLRDTYQVERIIIGLPLSLDGSFGLSAQRALLIAEEIREKCGLPVDTIDERFSTKQVDKIMINADVSRKKRRKCIDSLSAVLILQQYLDKQDRPVPDVEMA